MRFAANGPDIPDDLLLARDQGRVVFFCGAGVSRARANLPDFFGLAEKVISKLGVLPTSPAYRLIAEARQIDDRIGIPGLISADRIFGLLERDFLTRDIEEAVAQALKPASYCDLTAHEILLDLATSCDGSLRLVTTNFDRLFDACDRNFVSWQPPRLPDPSRLSEMHGIVYLHGKANSEYNRAENGNFVLSSSGFGRAYLSDGWATTFFKEVIRQYIVVFVGYAADDPPVQYLLEALNAPLGRSGNAYAFQAGSISEADARWLHKGVQAVAYNDADSHGALWQTLTAWAARAKNVDGWYTGVINHAKIGPSALLPHERGQVAHVLSTYEGVKKFTKESDVPPAEWLCVLDPARRYAKPARVGPVREQGSYIDPFDLYGLDSDLAPRKIDPQDHYAKREVPPGAWNGLAITKLDQTASDERNLAVLQGPGARGSAQLVPRLSQLGIWLSTVAWQPAAVWWASHQGGLHADILHSIKWRMIHFDHGWTTTTRKACLFLCEAWDRHNRGSYSDCFELENLISKEGWDITTPRRYANALRPYVEMGINYWQGPIPPLIDAQLGIGDLIRRDVKYPDRDSDIHIPNEWVASTTRALRQNLERALDLENELGGYGLTNVSPIIPDDQLPNDDHHIQRTQGLSGAVLHFVSLFSRLVALDTDAARKEFHTWPADDDGVFARLRIWASGKTEFASPSVFEKIISGLSDTAFWDSYHQRDLLLVLAHRWNDLRHTSQKKIEKKLLRGPKRWEGEADDEFLERRAYAILTRLCWLSERDIMFTQNVETAQTMLKAQAPRWRLEYAARATGSMESRGGWVKTETNYAALLLEPLSFVVAKAKELRGRTETFVEHDPFAGLVAERPVRAFLALLSAAKAGEVPEWAWRRFLGSEARKTDGSRLASAVAMRLVRFRPIEIAPFIHAAADWFLCVAKILAARKPPLFYKATSVLLEVIKLQLPGSGTALSRSNSEPDWIMEALNSPSGKIARGLCDDPRNEGLTIGVCLPQAWLLHIENLLSLGQDQRRQAIVILFRNLDWFHAIDPVWATAHLLPFMNAADSMDKDAACAGFLWGAKVPHRNLYMHLKPALMAAAARSRQSSRHKNIQVLAGILLAGWASDGSGQGGRCLSDDEMRAVLLNGDDDFRSAALWQAERWAESAGEGTSETWDGLLLQLIKNVWPRQASVKSSRMSGRLCNLAFANTQRFPKIVPLILPLLTRAEDGGFRLPHLQGSSDCVVSHPSLTLALLHAVLPNDTSRWPYGIDSVLHRIVEVHETLKSDERLVSLQRLWEAR